jgi:hypothetical protein
MTCGLIASSLTPSGSPTPPPRPAVSPRNGPSSDGPTPLTCVRPRLPSVMVMICSASASMATMSPPSVELRI